METLKSKGVDVAMDVFPMEGDLVAFIRDNTGNLIELIQHQPEEAP
jgi:methylmalonyl-CoA/ethylmalonyl-CoA epimerase